MKPIQIFNVVNDIAMNVTNGQTRVIDATTFVSFGRMIQLDENLRDVVYRQLIDRIGRTLFAIRTYSAKNRSVLLEIFQYGALLQKISYKMQNAEQNKTYDTTGENPYTLTPKGGIIQEIYEGILPTFEYKDVIMSKQLESAFLSPEAMAGFISGLYTRMSNAYEVAIEGLQDSAIATSIALLFDDSQNQNYSRRSRNVLAEYKALYPDSDVTVATCERDKGFLQYVVTELLKIPSFLEKYTSLYNDGTVERVTSKENLIFELSNDFATAFDVYLSANTFHKELLKLPNFSTVPYWQTPTEPDTVRVKVKVQSEEDGTTTDKDITVSGIIGYMRDRDAVACTMERKRQVNKYDEWNDRTYTKIEGYLRYAVFRNENSILFYVAD